jgi:hypothetical protein
VKPQEVGVSEEQGHLDKARWAMNSFGSRWFLFSQVSDQVPPPPLLSMLSRCWFSLLPSCIHRVIDNYIGSLHDVLSSSQPPFKVGSITSPRPQSWSNAGLAAFSNTPIPIALKRAIC